ncbi:uncharacterized protein LOC128547912 [Mercenaria mercenaria]|uniref:uncharacterized protein LOC128547912 n=1 Tax=Mercenaria mercenaria TaxID=6596 RepID=UPI00234E564D|nr:uncharacterized protein LOC128547912 [Mercenaria mercenaria]
MTETEGPKSKETLSVAISYLLDHLGYSDQRIKERCYFAAKSSFAKCESTKRILKNTEIEKIFIGSQSDGTGLTRLSDIDMLQVNHAVICVENANDVPDKRLVAFKLDYKSTPTGYSQLLLINKGTDERFAEIKYALVYRNGKQYLSSDRFMTRNDDVFLKSKGFIGRNTCYYPRKGPSIPKYVKETYLEQFANYCTGFDLPKQSMDFIRAFPCKSKSLLKSWSQSNKTSKWPSQKMKDVIMTLPMHVVPVGHKTSRNRGNEWRVSFTMAEQYLVQSFNNSQVKLLVLLKLIAKHLLHPISPDITSYIMKHVTFWILAKHAEAEFKLEHLYQQTEISLLFLKSSIESGKLLHFIATKRNLFEQKISKAHKTKLLEKVTFLLDNGQSIVSQFLWDTNELGKFLVVREEIKKMAIASAVDNTENFKTTLFSYKSFSDYMEN